MAKVTDPLRSSEARGKVGGVIYNSWRGISYVKRFTAPVQPMSEKQMHVRVTMQEANNAWRNDLNAAGRALWDAYAQTHLLLDWTGQPKRISGQNWFIRCFVQQRLIPVAVTETVPSENPPDGVVNLTLTNEPTSFDFDWTPTAGTDITLNLWADGPLSPGRQGTFSRARSILYTPGEAGSSTSGTLGVGDYAVWVRMIRESDGLTSVWTTGRVTVG